MDGIRAYWDGTTLFSKHGKKLKVPEDFTKDFPTIPLDGELWGGRGTYDKIMALLNQKEKKGGWESVGYYVFDAPTLGETTPYETEN